MLVRYRRDPDKPFEFTPEERARLEAMTDEEIIAGAEADPDNPPLTEEQLSRMCRVADVRRTREALGLSQEDFSRRYRFSLGRLRDLEQGRTRPDSVVSAYLRLIEADPEFVRRTLEGTPPTAPGTLSGTTASAA